jgi:hypothetical protein
MPPSSSFTLKANGIVHQLLTKCSACAAFNPAAIPQHLHPAYHDFQALWDTGATSSVITQKVVDTCGLKPIGVTKVYHAQGESLADKFLVNIALPNGVAFANLSVTKGDIRGADMLIGMEIITAGDFAITNKNGITIFTFRVPSSSTMDFVKEANAQAAVPKYVHAKQGKRRRRH